MSHSVYARLSGFGWTLLPGAPFRFERVPHRPRLILVEHRTADGPRRAMLDFDDPAVELAEGTSRLEEVLEFTEGPNFDHWRMVTSVYSVRWPEGFAVGSTTDPPGFDFIGPNGTLIYLQGPFDCSHVPPFEEMASPEQQIHQ